MENLYEKTCRAFNKANVAYLVIGGFAVNFYGYNRSTGDMDFYINPDQTNISRLMRALDNLGFETGDTLMEAIEKGQLVHFSDRMHVVELLFTINLKTPFDELYQRAMVSQLGKSEVRFIGFDDLMAEKMKAQRPKDLNDVTELQKVRRFFNL